MLGTRLPEGFTSKSRRPGFHLKLPGSIVIVLGLLATVASILVLRTGANITFTVDTDRELKMALQRATGGETIVIEPGTYGFHHLPKPYASRVTIRGADRRRVQIQGFSTVSDASASTAAANVLITDLTVSGPDRRRDAVRINKGAHDIEIADVTIEGGQHGVDINASPYSSGVTWPYNITVENSDLSGSTGDLVQIVGGRGVTFRHNFFHDPQDNPDDHVDGIQSIASDGLQVVGNWFTESAKGATGPNQAIILGRADPYNEVLTVRRSYVVNNLISGWRGSGILLAGTQTTWVANNTSMPYSGQSGFVIADKNPNESGGTAEAWYNTDLRVWNNIFNKVSTDSETAPVFNSNNLITDSATGYGENSITGRARFVTTSTTSSERYKLQRVSPAIDSGIKTPDGKTPQTDLDGLSRRGLPDRGALEYVRSTGTGS
jgi:Right handed beta helix region